MKFAVIGAGAVGCFIASLLHEANKDVVLVCRPTQKESFQSNGISIVREGVLKKHFLPVVDKLAGAPDVVIFAVKAHDIMQAYREHNDHLDSNCYVITIQNGVQAENMLSIHFDPERIIAGIAMVWAYYDGDIITIQREGKFILGRAFYMNNPTMRAITDEVAEALPVEIVDQIMERKWLKLLVNMSNSLPAILGKSIAEAYTYDEVCQINYHMGCEMLQICKGYDIKMADVPGYFTAEEIVGMYESSEQEGIDAIKARFSSYSDDLVGSMRQSLQRRSVTEIDYINGEALQYARTAKIKLPVNDAIVDLIHKVERSGTPVSLEELVRYFPFCAGT